MLSHISAHEPVVLVSGGAVGICLFFCRAIHSLNWQWTCKLAACLLVKRTVRTWGTPMLLLPPSSCVILFYAFTNSQSSYVKLNLKVVVDHSNSLLDSYENIVRLKMPAGHPPITRSIKSCTAPSLAILNWLRSFCVRWQSDFQLLSSFHHCVFHISCRTLRIPELNEKNFLEP